MAALLHKEVAAQGKFGIALAPGVRMATPQESHDIKTAVEPLLGQAGANEKDEGLKQFKQDRAKGLVAKLDDRRRT
jgi:hypothetical protein